MVVKRSFGRVWNELYTHFQLFDYHEDKVEWASLEIDRNWRILIKQWLKPKDPRLLFFFFLMWTRKILFNPVCLGVSKLHLKASLLDTLPPAPTWNTAEITASSDGCSHLTRAEAWPRHTLISSRFVFCHTFGESFPLGALQWNNRMLSDLKISSEFRCACSQEHHSHAHKVSGLVPGKEQILC